MKKRTSPRIDVWELDEDNIEPEEMPLCPICGQPLDVWEPVVAGIAHGMVALAHKVCVGE